MIVSSKRILVTDGWHPTINPSSRMPIHHHRFVDLLGEHVGILNELPRQYGGNTLRAMHIDCEGNLYIFDLNKTMKYMPWWISAASKRAVDLITNIVTEAIENNKCLTINSYKLLLKTYMDFAWRNRCATLGEVLCCVNDFLYKSIYPDLPDIHLTSIMRLDERKVFAECLSKLSADITGIFDSIGISTNKKEFGFLGVLTDINGKEYRLTYSVGDSSFHIFTMYKPHLMQNIEIKQVIDALYNGTFLPSSQLLIVIEVELTLMGFDVVHFGNAYGRHEAASIARGTENKVSYWADNLDSWNFIMLQGNNGVMYPLHLMELISAEDRVKNLLPSLIKKSLIKGTPIIAKLRKGGSLFEALSD